MASFMDYYNEELSKRSSAPVRAVKKPPVKTIQELNGNSGADEGIFDPRNPIGWALDMLSRPLYGAQNVVEDKIKKAGAAGRKIAQGDGSGFGDVLSSMFTPVAGEFAQGMFSNEKKDKITSSKNIELGMDEANSLNKDYENTENNVNPITKGILGFVGDVGTDPLTYIPGGAYASVGRNLAKVVKGGVEGAKGAVKAAKGEKAVEEIVEAAAPVEVPALVPARQTEENPFEGTTAQVAPAAQGKKLDTSPERVNNPPNSLQVFDDITPDVPIPKIGPQGKKIPASTEASAGIVTPPSVAAAPEVVEVLAGTKSLSQAIKDSPRAAGMRAEIKSLFDDVKNTNPATPKQPTTFKDWLVGGGSKKTAYVNLPGDGQARSYTMGELAKIASVKEPALAQRAQAARAAVQGAYAEAQTIKATAVTDAVQAFGQRISNGEKQLRATLGEDLVDLLKGVTSPVTMTRTLNQLDRILSGAVDVEAFGARNSASQRLLDTISRSLGDDTSPALPSLPGQPHQQAAVLSETSEVFRQAVRQEMLPGTPEFNAKYAEFAKGNPLTFTEKDLDARLGRWWRKANSFFQYTLYAKLWEDVLKNRIVRQTGSEISELKGRVNAVAVRDAVNSMGDDITRALDTFGAPLHIGVDDKLVKLTFPQVYQALDEIIAVGAGDDAALLALHNGGTRVAFTRLMEAVHLSITSPGVGADEIAELLRAPLKSGARGGSPGGELPNNITANGKGWYSPVKNLSPKMEEMAAALGGKWVKGAKQGYQLTFTKGGQLPELLAEAIVRAREPLTELAAKNAEDWAARGIAESAEISGQALARLRRLANDPSKAAQRELANAIKAQPKAISDDAAAIAATPEGTLAAQTTARAAVGERAIKEAEAVVSQERHLKEGMDAAEAGKTAMAERVNAVDDEGLGNWREMLEEPSPATAAVLRVEEDDIVRKLDIGEMADIEVQSAINGTLRQRAGKAFSRQYDIDPRMKDEQLAVGTRIGDMTTRDIIRPVKALARAHSPETLGSAVKAIQQRTKLAPGSELATAATGIERVISTMFDTASSNPVMGNVFLESGADLERLNGALRWAFDGRSNAPQFDIALAQNQAKQALGGKATNAALKARTHSFLKEQWREWDLSSDAAASLVRLGQAAGRVVEHQAVAASFIKRGKQHGFVVQLKPGEKVPAGYVKPTASRSTELVSLLPKGTYILEEIAPTLARMEYLTTASRQVSGEVGDLIRSSIVPITNTWKQGMTIYRLGHHIRNVIGNLSLQYVSRGVRDFNRAQTAAFKIMGRRGDYEGVDFLQMLRSLGDEALPTGGDVIVRGRHGDIATDEIIEAMSQRGMFPTYEASEGLLTEEVKRGGIIERALRPLDAANNPVGRLGAKTSEVTDHHGRVAHFVQILMQESSKRGGKWKGASKEKLYDLAANEVRKFHPDSSMLTAFENKYAKIAIPFYTWLRGILPGALESAAMYPGRVMAFPKASYNLAVAMGLNPESLGDPFPEDQLFPSFIRESVFGPQFKFGDTYVKVNPGIAHADIAQTFGADPIRGLLGMTNPLFRVPAELAAGGSMQTGGRIADAGDYVDQTLPGVNYLANLTGISPTGSIESILAGEGLDPQQQVEKGNKTDMDKLISGINWLTGIGVQNVSRPNYVNYAEIEKRNAAAKEK